jgi:hypothetical protein
MKKLFLVLTVLTLSFIPMGRAYILHVPQLQQVPVLPEILFQAISVNNLPEAIQRAILDEHRNAVIVAAEEGVLPNGERIYRVNFTGTQDDGEESRIYYANGSLFNDEQIRGEDIIQQKDNNDDNDEDRDNNDQYDNDALKHNDMDQDDPEEIRFRQP